ncbi:hypothetical protein O9929_08480 [Vibrio lentus]|nr:hypothetical protein [Vibrio lentus]
MKPRLTTVILNLPKQKLKPYLLLLGELGSGGLNVALEGDDKGRYADSTYILEAGFSYRR